MDQSLDNTPGLTPPPELVQQWADMLASRSDEAVFSLAAQWGGDQELEACCEWLDKEGWSGESRQLCAARRPKPPSLKEQALEALDHIEFGYATGEFGDTIRRALEALPDD